jgi:hypothetical protein
MIKILAFRAELRVSNLAAQARTVSVARIRLDSRKSARPFKGIIRDYISEFESYMPSHAVQSLRDNPRAQCAQRVSADARYFNAPSQTRLDHRT